MPKTPMGQKQYSKLAQPRTPKQATALKCAPKNNEWNRTRLGRTRHNKSRFGFWMETLWTPRKTNPAINNSIVEHCVSVPLTLSISFSWRLELVANFFSGGYRNLSHCRTDKCFASFQAERFGVSSSSWSKTSCGRWIPLEFFRACTRQGISSEQNYYIFSGTKGIYRASAAKNCLVYIRRGNFYPAIFYRRLSEVDDAQKAGDPSLKRGSPAFISLSARRMWVIAVRISCSDFSILIFNKMLGAQRLGLLASSFLSFSFCWMDATCSLVSLDFILPLVVLVVSLYIFRHWTFQSCVRIYVLYTVTLIG